MHTHGGRLSYADAQEIRRRYSQNGLSQQALADDYGVSQRLISSIVRNVVWQSPTVDCHSCGQPFEPTSSTSRYCSDECFIAGRRKRVMRRWREAHPFEDRTCPHCGDEFTQRRLDQCFCSQRCEQAAHNATRKARWRAKDGITVEYVSRAAIINRDGYICHLCGGAVEPDDIHIDHVQPLARWGSHSETNLAVSHSRCNLRKGARTTQTQRWETA